MTVLKIPKEIARVLADIDAPYDGWPSGDFAAEIAPYNVTGIVENRHTGKEKRWTSVHELVIRSGDGKLWQAFYEQGLTENQEEGPFEYAGPEITFKEVVPVEVKTTGYQPAP